jgi:mono/diheme cytochrome c family protein
MTGHEHRPREAAHAIRQNPRALLFGMLLGAAGILAASIPATDVQAQAPAATPDGAEVFRSAGCSGCHGDNGEGGLGPQLAGDPALTDTAFVVNQVLHGGQIMPAVGEGLTDAQVVAVINFIRSSWGNTAPDTVTAEQVAAARG